jgi:hypothetical protein
MHIWEMEEGEGALSHGKESKCHNISVGNAESIKWAQEYRGKININRDNEKLDNISAKLQIRK